MVRGPWLFVRTAPRIRLIWSIVLHLAVMEGEEHEKQGGRIKAALKIKRIGREHLRYAGTEPSPHLVRSRGMDRKQAYSPVRSLYECAPIFLQHLEAVARSSHAPISVRLDMAHVCGALVSLILIRSLREILVPRKYIGRGFPPAIPSSRLRLPHSTTHIAEALSTCTSVPPLTTRTMADSEQISIVGQRGCLVTLGQLAPPHSTSN
jgi:hypothetical protein